MSLFRRLPNSRWISHCRSFSSIMQRSVIDELQKSSKNVLVHNSNSTGIAILAMNFQKKKNALSKIFVEDMSSAISVLERDKKSIVLVVCSLVNNVFCAGADLRERAVVPDEEVPNLVGGLRSLFQRIYALPFPTIAALDGAALGGGLEMALACDIRFAGISPNYKLGLIESHWALLPGAGGSQRLPRIIGVAKAKELMFAATRLSAVEAFEYGVVNKAVDPEKVPDEWKDKPALYGSFAYASQLCTKGPIALKEIKRAVNEGLSMGSIERGLQVEGDCYRALVSTKDRKEGMEAFMEKRQPIYHGF